MVASCDAEGTCLATGGLDNEVTLHAAVDNDAVASKAATKSKPMAKAHKKTWKDAGQLDGFEGYVSAAVALNLELKAVGTVTPVYDSATTTAVQLGSTALHMAAASGDAEAVRLLLAAGARTDVEDKARECLDMLLALPLSSAELSISQAAIDPAAGSQTDGQRHAQDGLLPSEVAIADAVLLLPRDAAREEARAAAEKTAAEAAAEAAAAAAAEAQADVVAQEIAKKVQLLDQVVAAGILTAAEASNKAGAYFAEAAPAQRTALRKHLPASHWLWSNLRVLVSFPTGRSSVSVCREMPRKSMPPALISSYSHWPWPVRSAGCARRGRHRAKGAGGGLRRPLGSGVRGVASLCQPFLRGGCYGRPAVRSGAKRRHRERHRWGCRRWFSVSADRRHWLVVSCPVHTRPLSQDALRRGAGNELTTGEVVKHIVMKR